MKLTVFLNSVSAFAFAALVAAPAFADQSMPAAKGAQTVSSSAQTLTPLAKKWWTED
jgi:hypothetical protein